MHVRTHLIRVLGALGSAVRLENPFLRAQHPLLQTVDKVLVMTECS